jgi:hypothetical protein
MKKPALPRADSWSRPGHQGIERPQPIRHASRHRRGHPHLARPPAEVVVGQMLGNARASNHFAGRILIFVLSLFRCARRSLADLFS